MAEKRFLVGVSNVFAYNKSTNDLLFTSRAMMDTSIEVSISNTDINSGQGNSLQYIYFHTPDMNVTLTDAQFNLEMISANVGSSIVTGDDIWDEETVTLGAGGTGSVTNGTPLITPDATTTIYGWVTDASGSTTRVTFTGSNFTLAGGSDGDVVCVRYYRNDSATRSVTIPANFLPSNVRLVMDCQLASGTDTDISGSSIIGKVQFEIDSCQLSGAQSIEMSSSGVSTTPLTGRALATGGTGGCSGASGLYGTIREIINNANWYDNVQFLAVENDPVELTHPDTEQLIVWAIPSSGASFQVPDLTDLTFVSGTPATCTVDANGLITTVASGTSVIDIEVTAKTSVQTTANVVVS